MASDEKKSLAYVCLALFAVSFAVIRLYFAHRLQLSPDEAYYWTWSRMEGPCYPDHPPLVARLIELGTRLLGDTSVGVRLPAIVFGEVHLVLVYFLLRQIGLSRLWSVAGAGTGCALPIVATGSIIMTPDAPLGLAWTVATICLVVLTRRPSFAAWTGLVLAFCFAFLAKLSALLIGVMAVTAFFASARMRRDAATAAPYLAGLLCCGFVLVVGWEMLECPHVRTQIDHLSGRLAPLGADVSVARAPVRILELFAGQVGLATPPLLWFAVRGFFEHRRDPAMQVLGLSFSIPLIATTASALTTHPEQNWASLGHPALGAAAFFYLTTIWPRRGKVIATVAFVFAASALIHAHALWTILPLPSHKDPVSRLHGWSRLDYLLKNIEKHGVVLSDDYGLAAQIVWSQRRSPALLRTVVALDREGPAGQTEAALIIVPCGIDGECRADWATYDCESYGDGTEFSMYRADGLPARKIFWRMGHRCRFERGFRLVAHAKED